MTVAELVAKLQSLPQDAVVVDKDPRERYGYFFHITDAVKLETYDSEDESTEHDSCVVLHVGDIASRQEMGY